MVLRPRCAASVLALKTCPAKDATVASAETAEQHNHTNTNTNMKNIIIIVAAILAVGISGCAHKKAPACADGKSCCAKKK